MSLWAAGLLRCVMPHLFLSVWASNPADEDQDLPLAPGHAVERGGGVVGGCAAANCRMRRRVTV